MEEALKESVWRSLLKSLSEVSLLSSQATGKERILMDEAIFQRCFTLFAYTDTDVSDGLVSRYADLAPIATHVIWIDTSPETSIGRLKERYLNHPSPYAPYSDELLAQFARGRKALSILSEVLRHRGHTVYRVNGDLGKDEVIQQASRHLSDIFSLPSKALSA